MLSEKELLQIKNQMGDCTKELSVIFKALSDPMRCHIFELIAKESEPLCVSDIATYFDLSHSATSQKLKILESHDLIERNREGKEVFYQIKRNSVVQSVVAMLSKMRK